MPAGKEGSATEDRRGSNAAKRETFRPPWVKEGPDGLPPKPSNLWSKTRQSSKDGPAPETTAAAAPKRGSTAKLDRAQSQENGTATTAAASKEHTFVKPQLKPVPPKEPTKLQSREVKVPVKLNSVGDRQKDPPEVKKPPLNRTKTLTSDDKNIDKAVPTERNAIIRQESLKKMTAPKAPPMPPPAPALPRATDLKPLSDKQKNLIESLKARPKVRPDWSSLLKDVEAGRKLKHVQCNDRSKPLLSKTKVVDSDKEQFIYESEQTGKSTKHNLLLKEIQQGVALRKTKTNDRSKPQLEGLRKFRRQMTIEEQIIKSQSMASIPPEEIADETDELDDIDKVRDDLQSTKQMLAIELRNKESLQRDNKRLQTRVQQLETEMDKEKGNKKTAAAAAAPVEPTEADEKLLKSLKFEAADARKTAEDLEKKFHDAADQLDHTKSELEEVRKQKLLLEKRLQDSVHGGKRLSLSDRKDSVIRSESEEEEAVESDSGGEDTEEKKERRAQREVKQLRNKLRGYKNKEDNAKKERMALKTQIKRMQDAIKNEKKKYKGLQKEVAKMEAMMKEVGDSSDEDEEKEEKADEESESETESETESSETDDSESEKSVSEAEDAPVEKKKTNLTKRTKKHEGRLSALKKGNYMLKTNVERLQDDLNKQKEESVTLQQDLDSVLAELG